MPSTEPLIVNSNHVTGERERRRKDVGWAEENENEGKGEDVE